MNRMKDRDLQSIKKNVVLGNLVFPTIELVKGLLAHAEAIEDELLASEAIEIEAVRKYGEAELNIDRLIDNVAQLQRELTEAREAKKVVLPKGVAEAIEFYQGQSSDGSTILALYNLVEIERLSKIGGNKFAYTLWDYIFYRGYNKYFLALINGYTVEKTKEERLREGVENLVEKWWGSPQNPDYIKANLTQSVFDFVTKFNTENE